MLYASPNGTGPGVRRIKRPLLASRTHCNVLWKLQKFGNRSKSVIKSSSVISSQIGAMSDQFLNVCPFDYAAFVVSGKVGIP